MAWRNMLTLGACTITLYENGSPLDLASYGITVDTVGDTVNVDWGTYSMSSGNTVTVVCEPSYSIEGLGCRVSTVDISMELFDQSFDYLAVDGGTNVSGTEAQTPPARVDAGSRVTDVTPNPDEIWSGGTLHLMEAGESPGAVTYFSGGW